jgi:alkaline phosphatase D
VPAPVPTHETRAGETTALEHIAFGSCLKQDLPMPILADVVAAQPELFLFLGDNVYADGPDETRLRAAYDALAARPEFVALQTAVPMFATWDDHDYGINDGGAGHPQRDAAQRVMLEFFAEPQSSVRWQRVGVYDARVFGPVGRRVQIVMLDTRSFRDPLVPTQPGGFRYVPTTDANATILGDAQWRWLEAELQTPAELRLLVSSIQVIADEHPFESWSRFPAERARLLSLLARTPGVIVLSGDRHRAELSRHDGDGYPLFDFTSSSLNLPIHGEDPNRYRVGPVVESSNFARIDIDWSRGRVRLALVLEGGETALEHELAITDLAP